MHKRKKDQKLNQDGQRQKLGLLINLLISIILGGLVIFFYFFAEAPKKR